MENRSSPRETPITTQRQFPRAARPATLRQEPFPVTQTPSSPWNRRRFFGIDDGKIQLILKSGYDGM